MKINFVKTTALFISISLALAGLSACGEEETPESVTTETTVSADTAYTAETEPAKRDTLTVGCDDFSGNFSPFFYETDSDAWVVKATNVSLLGRDRGGNVVLSGILGETTAYEGTDYTYIGISDCTVTVNEDGTAAYDIKLRENIRFSDGTPLTADDVIFTMYVLSDPSYDGPETFNTIPVVGMDEYRNDMSSMFSLLYRAGRENEDFTYWDEFTQTDFWRSLDEAGTKFVEEIIDWLVNAGYNGKDDTVAECMENWGIEVPEDADEKDAFYIMLAEYNGDIEALSETETAGSSFKELMSGYDEYLKSITTGEPVNTIEGIGKTGEYSLRITTEKYDPKDIYSLCIYVASLNFYGDAELYDYENLSYGFAKGDLSAIRAKNGTPFGGGTYIFESYEDGVVSLKANENYWKGRPLTENLKLRETKEEERLAAVSSGLLDIACISPDTEDADEIKALNSNGGLSGDVITTSLYDNPGYGYIGISAENVKVGDDKSGNASKNLRKAFATIFAYYRNEAIEAYYGDAAEVIDYPISNTSWAAPQKSDESYRTAYCKDADGYYIYRESMKEDARKESMVEAVKGFFEAAGFTYDENTGTFAEAPEGAKLEYEIIIPGSGVGSHPAYEIARLSAETLKTMGITLKIKDPTDTNTLWEALDRDTAEMWAAAWSANADPDMYSVYHSDNYKLGTNMNLYAIEDDYLDSLIEEARTDTDTASRKETYRKCLDIVLDWGVEVPVYQRRNAYIYNSQSVNTDSVTMDMTYSYDWLDGIENLEMN